ncbi:hypothetical protein [Caldifermentibacillus hisashii]|uniref:hypothetical protein n=1 Tax=Caldifermentibacillus hisashii TaxID=996558 RepID=UPI003D1F4100
MSNIGKLVKLKRLEKNMKQDELCRGICTPSYLSRIENNLVIADDGLYTLLFERLGINYRLIGQNSSLVDSRIENWYRNLLEMNEGNEDIEELKEFAQIAGEESYSKFQIVYCRYLLIKNDMEEADKLINTLRQVIPCDTNRNFFLLANVLLLFYIKKNDFVKAIETGEKLIKQHGYECLGRKLELGIFYYNLALSYKNLYYYELASSYVKRALSIFKDEYLLERALACHIILGTCYNNLGKFQDSLDTYQLAERILDYLPKEEHKKYRFAINNNLGNCFEFQGKYLEAVNYYIEATKYLTYQDPNNAILNLIRCYYTLGDFSNAKKWIQKARSNDSGMIPEKFDIQYKVFETIMADNLTVECMIDIQKLSIDYFLSMNDWMLTAYYSKLFASLYESNNLYKQANSMYKLALQIRNENIQGENEE